jgi:hypothetical protein
MRTLLVLCCAAVASLALAASAGATAPIHDSFTFHDRFVDDDTCSFPIAGDVVFTNDITEFSDASGSPTMLQLHQSSAGTLIANGITLRLNIRETIVVEFLDGIPMRAKHVGLLNSIVGPGGPVFLRTGQALFEVVLDPASGFYVDGIMIARHGLRDVFDPVSFCAAFA